MSHTLGRIQFPFTTQNNNIVINNRRGCNIPIVTYVMILLGAVSVAGVLVSDLLHILLFSFYSVTNPLYGLSIGIDSDLRLGCDSFTTIIIATCFRAVCLKLSFHTTVVAGSVRRKSDGRQISLQCFST